LSAVVFVIGLAAGIVVTIGISALVMSSRGIDPDNPGAQISPNPPTYSNRPSRQSD